MNSITHITSLLEEMLPGPRPINAYAMDFSLYRMYKLCASTFRRGRCLLAGDAANLNNVRVATHLSPNFLEEFGLPFFQQWRVDLKEVILQTL
ncbi:hypothetical protein PITC_082510 [Penicillium italicum]|uniref:Monooxygenase, FAD-binding n=1 Tax=Penicillium italicum TaxID=40296 RepID=A0A0A2L6B6_PENIT|nr:hypothetical protein PITC_082510 [Penicillium italicum]